MKPPERIPLTASTSPAGGDVPEGRGSTERLGQLGPALYTYTRCRLEILGGQASSTSVEFDLALIRIGSDPSCDLHLEDPAASRLHATLELAPNGYRLRDTNSTNGTFVDGIRITEAYPTAGSTLQFGRIRVRFEPICEQIEATPSLVDRFHGILGRSAAMRQIFTLLERLAATSISVLITGETGTGKELVARALHRASQRSRFPFVVFDCGNTDRELVRSELFGHEPGAFTGATAQRLGVFERAQGGTVFLDEIGELPLELQPRLLRVLQEREVMRLGGSAPHRVDLRVVAASHRDLLAMVRQGLFREDLYFRLAQVVLRVPPLRERPEDIPLLAAEFLAAASAGLRLSMAATGELFRRTWRGNVRELRNCIEAAAALCLQSEVRPEDLPSEPPASNERVAAQASTAPPRDLPIAPTAESALTAGLPVARAQAPIVHAPGPPTPLMTRSLEDVERETIGLTLQSNAGNLSRTARALGIARSTLREKLRKYGLG